MQANGRWYGENHQWEKSLPQAGAIAGSRSENSKQHDSRRLA
ncbi:hypothetical protein Mal15_56200 [Stieleria maiorica]|uniref:Uncharacterized protein n=1 Tax=Stieleria maiorica TaxID=2795974 RepID=A0A5B9MJK0_9BACT|nr:hypothetical protein Mal15_56200 [Stieleria maiorica]